MAGFIRNLFKVSCLALVVPMVAFGTQKENPRGNVSGRNAVGLQESESAVAVRRSATSVIARSVSENNRKKRAVVVARPAVSSSRIVKARSARPYGATNVNKSRAGVATNRLVGDIGNKSGNGKNISRAATARATAVFNDITKIGGGYANCRDAYATCMDQMCANANDTYRRCFCSDRFADFRDTSDKLDTALKMLADFQDNNLNAVDKTAAEVNAMYSASDGEKAIKKDTSASQKLLDSIGDVLSGKSNQTKKSGLGSLGVLDFSGFGTGDDIWGGSDSFFGGDSTNIADLEGKELYNKASKQCSEITREACGSDAMFNLARSSYSVMISQDCNAFEKNINAKKASVEETVRTAEKYLRDARLDEYRKHNSADVNECLTKVEEAMRNPVACGPKFEKCMDYTGQYINTDTGEPIYSQALFGLNKLIVLNGSADVLGANKNFNKFLDDKKIFATTALDSCRDLADTVWYEFKRAALIQIAQAQDEKIQTIKDSCVSVIKECYDTQSDSLKELDTTEMQSTGAIAAVTARGMCYDRVQACAALYGDPDGCKYDDKTKKLTNASDTKKCGLQSLLAFVDTVDSVKVAEGCEAALTKYAHELCDEDIGVENPLPYGKCSRMPKAQVRAAMELRRKTFCAADLVKNDTSNTLQENDAFNTNVMNQIIKDIYDELNIAFVAGCEGDSEFSGTWVSYDELTNPQPNMLVQEFYRKYYGATITSANQINDLGLAELGWCVAGGDREMCEALGPYYAVLDSQGQCNLTDAWYQNSCETVLGGTWTTDVVNGQNQQVCAINTVPSANTNNNNTTINTQTIVPFNNINTLVQAQAVPFNGTTNSTSAVQTNLTTTAYPVNYATVSSTR